ncbi:hypothetical protein [Shinella sp. HZN7]|uniref:hypothetical protein n=1 Tax=Shinella sp. (strain HZN7) TaxID=879274 RepID=UPI0007DA5B5B|nr:hypothetical protein [Shinella sp. HZN7]ANH04975.1 hypothetical protein shn_13610 [Shinella sp. HZN7]
MAQFGLETTWDAIPVLGLDAFAHEFEESGAYRSIKVYSVPETVRPERYFIVETISGEVEEVPPSLVRDTLLLAHFSLPPEGDAVLFYAHPEVLAA